ncbi:hypothetical protein TREMEDRAFT_57992 [Tremella mesenterica DSM 1558]|nr:uncharacterized protein TREMEDRAFT_57992 [Tremella mesenterica DSM 1558]EIW65523.1 hypothetical protein TREMEDRAFT_57992 [Tremella mesenterica DSM 1558]
MIRKSFKVITVQVPPRTKFPPTQNDNFPLLNQLSKSNSNSTLPTRTTIFPCSSTKSNSNSTLPTLTKTRPQTSNPKTNDNSPVKPRKTFVSSLSP